MNKYKCPKCGMEYDKPGKCTMDGAKLVKMEEKESSPHSGQHHDHHRMMMQDFKQRFIISAIITIPILVLSPLIQRLLGFGIMFTGDKYVLFILSSSIFFYGGFRRRFLLLFFKKEEWGISV